MSEFIWFVFMFISWKDGLTSINLFSYTTHFYCCTSEFTGLWTLLVLLNNFLLLVWSWPVRIWILGLSASVKGKGRAVLCKDFFSLTGNKFSNSGYKVASGNEEKLLHFSSLRIACSTPPVLLSRQQRQCFLSLYLWYALWAAALLVMLAGA